MRIAFFTIIIFVVFRMNAQTKDEGYPITPVPFTSVKVTDHFWEPRLKANREVTIPLALKKCEESGRYENFIKASHPNDTIKVGGLPFDDTDVYKIIEGASYSMQTYPDKKLSHYIDSILMIVAAAQESDGYLYTSRTMNTKHPHNWAGNKRWEKVEELSHEFYNLGHMIEGAIAHYQATGKKNFLNIAIRYADCVEREIGNTPDKEIKVPGHQIAEMALAKLYVLTQNKKYLDLAKFFLDNRGYTSRKDAYSQAHKPVIEQDEAVGHAVRAAYMYSGMADIAALTGDTSYIHAIDKISPLQEILHTSMLLIRYGTMSLQRNFISPVELVRGIMERRLVIITNYPTCLLIVKLVQLLVMYTGTIVCFYYMAIPAIMIYWKERFTTDSYLVFHWMAAVSFIQIHWSLPVNTNANLGSDVPVVPLI